MPAFRLAPATEGDFERILDLRIRVMHEHLERVGRFDPARARALLRAGFSPATMRLILDRADEFAGCIDVVRHGGHAEIRFFYVEPARQRRGLGRAVLAQVMAERPDLPVRLEVLKGSPAVRFYERAGFRRTGELPFDLLYEHPARA